jgi:hypothetical protein
VPLHSKKIAGSDWFAFDREKIERWPACVEADVRTTHIYERSKAALDVRSFLHDYCVIAGKPHRNAAPASSAALLEEQNVSAQS